MRGELELGQWADVTNSCKEDGKFMRQYEERGGT